MQAINIAAYKRLGASYAEENGVLPETAEEEVENHRTGKQKKTRGNVGNKDGYQQLNGNSDSEDGYETAVDTDAEVDRSFMNNGDSGSRRDNGGGGYERGGYQRGATGENSEREPISHLTTSGGYQSLTRPEDYNQHSYQGYQTQQTWTHQAGQNEVADDCGYFKLEGFSEFCGNLTNMKNTDIGKEYTVQGGNTLDEQKKLYTDPSDMDSEDVKIEPTCELCSFRCMVKVCQMVFCMLSLVCAFFTNIWLTSVVGIWFVLVNFFCAGVASSVLLAQIYHKIDRLVICKRKLIQVTYVIMVPMLLSAGLLAASVATSSQYRLEFEKTMIMVSSMFCLMALFATITDVVMNRRTWRMFRLVGGNAYIHAAFMA